MSPGSTGREVKEEKESNKGFVIKGLPRWALGLRLAGELWQMASVLPPKGGESWGIYLPPGSVRVRAAPLVGGAGC